jgi:uncharacterized protein YigE (DUF2233 family)
MIRLWSYAARVAIAVIWAVIWVMGSAQGAAACDEITYQERSYTVCRADVGDDLRLFWGDGAEAYGTFSNVNAALTAEGKTLRFAMNAGMFHNDLRPVGYYLERGIERMRIVATAGPGNFGMLPNGVFCIGAQRFDVIETLRFVDQAPPCLYASQSGPMLVIDGGLHPRFLKDSTSRFYRNGVGTDASGQVAYFVISNRAVTFYEFGSFFKDVLNVPSALFFDGNVSRLFAPRIGRADFGRLIGPMVGVVEDTQPASE